MERNKSNSMQQNKQKGLMIFKTMRPFYCKSPLERNY